MTDNKQKISLVSGSVEVTQPNGGTITIGVTDEGVKAIIPNDVHVWGGIQYTED